MVLSSASQASAPPGTVRTYDTVLRTIVPKVANKLGVSVLPMHREVLFFGFFVGALLVGRRCTSPVTPQLTARWSNVKVVRVSVSYCRTVRGFSAIFDDGWSPQMVV